jgi:hypothetical protein
MHLFRKSISSRYAKSGLPDTKYLGKVMCFNVRTMCSMCLCGSF